MAYQLVRLLTFKINIMKKLAYLLPIFVAFIACNNNYQQPSSESSSSIASSNYTPQYSSPKDAAPEIARNFVRQEISCYCNFQSDVVVENTMVDNRYQVMQKFKSNGQEYVYKIFIQYFDGNVNDVSNWDFNQLVVEEVNSGKQSYYNGNLESRIKKTVGVGNTVEFAGVEFKIIDVRIGTSLAFSHKGKLTRKQIAEALKEMHNTYNYEVYHIYHDYNLKEDYIQWQSTGNLTAVFDFEKDKIYETPDDYAAGKAIN